MTTPAPMTAELLGEPRYAVRKTCYGKDAFDVIQVTKVTAKTHTIIEKGWRGDTWGRETRCAGLPDYVARFDSLKDAIAAAEAGNVAWRDHQGSVSVATQALSDARFRQRESAQSAVRCAAPSNPSAGGES